MKSAFLLLAAALLQAGACAATTPAPPQPVDATVSPSAPPATHGLALGTASHVDTNADWHFPLPMRSDTSWAALSGAQRMALAPLAGVWSGIEPLQQRRWLALAERYPHVPAPVQARIQARMAEWARMTPQQRGQARLQFREAQRLAPADRQARWNAYQALTPEQRRQWAERAASAASGNAVRHTAALESVGARAALPRPPSRLQTVTPTIVKAGPGATTVLISRTGAPPAHQRPGMPKIAVDAADVNRTTLLPKRGAQSATSISSAARSTAAAVPLRP